MKSLYLFGLIVFVSQSPAAPICPPTKSQIAGPLEVTKYLFKTSTIGSADRRTLKDFAKESGEAEAEIAKRYAASGDIYCEGFMAQALVVMKNDLILVPGHQLYKDKNCENANDVKKCKLYLTENGKRVSYDVAKEEAEGFTCPDSSSMKIKNDWAILRLRKPVSSSIKPYVIKSAPCATEEKPSDVVFVGKSDDFKYDSKKPMIEAARHYGRCHLLKGNCEGSYPVMESDCDMAPGASGGGLFVGGKDPQLIGINTAQFNTCPGSATDKTGPYRAKCWSAASVPIAGELKDRLERLASE